MTAAFNISQLGNNLNTAGQLDASDGLFGVVPVANGGTGQSSLTSNAVLLGNSTSGVQAVAPSTAGNVLTSNGTTWQSAALPSNQIGVGQTWQDVTASRSVGVTYTNTTGKPIMIQVTGSGSNPYGVTVQIYVSGLLVSQDLDYQWQASCTGCAIVPNGATYSAFANWVYSRWVELR